MEPIVLSGILGFFVPPVVSFLKNSKWPSWLKVGLSVVVSGVVAVLSLVQDGSLTEVSWTQIVANVGVAFAVATAFYNAKFQDTAVNAKLEAKKVL